MAAVIRLKRPLNEEPSEALILNCKRRKTDENVDKEAGELSTVLRFAGTIDKQEDIYTHLKKPTKSDLEDQFKKHTTDISAKLRSQKQEDSRNNRYKVVSCFRSQSLDSDKIVEKENDTEYTIYDIETDNKEESTNKDNETKYVYDLYYTTSDDLGDAYMEDYVRYHNLNSVSRGVYIFILWSYFSMYPYNDTFIYGSMRDNGVNEPDTDDSEDSNAENNWKNDYPDESDMESVTENDMLEAMKKCDLDDLSSDDGEEGFVYSVDSESAGFEEDIDDSDVQRYGERYARFRAKHKKEVQTTVFKDLYYGDIDEDEYYY